MAEGNFKYNALRERHLETSEKIMRIWLLVRLQRAGESFRLPNCGDVAADVLRSSAVEASASHPCERRSQLGVTGTPVLRFRVFVGSCVCLSPKEADSRAEPDRAGDRE